MGKQQIKVLGQFIIGYILTCIICLGIVAWACSDDSNWMSYLGSFLGGILGGLATLIAIYVTLASLKQDVKPHIFPMRTILYGYYCSGRGIYLLEEDIPQDSMIIAGQSMPDHEVRFNPFNTCMMKFANVGKDSALNIKFEWSKPFDSELYDILLEYGIPHTYFEEHFDTEKKATLYGDYMLPIKVEKEGYRVQITDELIELFVYIMSVFLGTLKEFAKDDKQVFGNNFVNKKQKFATVKITYDDLNGNTTVNEYIIYCRIQRILGSYNGGYNKIKIELTTCESVN